jgi:hypothetical protein
LCGLGSFRESWTQGGLIIPKCSSPDFCRPNWINGPETKSKLGDYFYIT